jgi:hypothetical protein
MDAGGTTNTTVLQEMDHTEYITEWVVQRIRRDLRQVTIPLPSSSSPASFIARLRGILPELCGAQPSVLLGQVREHGFLDLGTVSGRDAQRIATDLRANGFSSSVVDASTTTLFPVNRVRGYATIIKDDAEYQSFCLDLISRGAVVEEVEA